MAEHYRRSCNNCGESIRMAKMDNGQWLPFDIEGGKHHCDGGFAASTVSRGTHPVTVPQLADTPPVRSSESCGESSLLPRSGIRWPVWLLLLFILWLLIQWLRSWWA